MHKTRIPHVFVILIALILFACLLTYLIPSGEFDRQTDSTSGQTVVVAGSFHQVEASSVSPLFIIQKFMKAVATESTASLIFFILLIGGSFEIVTQTGCITKLCKRMLQMTKQHQYWMIAAFVAFFSVFGFTMGLATASVVFVPIGILAAKEMGFNKITGIAMVALGTNAGFSAGVFNPFSVGIAQSIAELPLYSGAWLRFVLLIVLVSATSLYIIRYASHHRTDLSKNAAENVAGITPDQSMEIEQFTLRDKIIIAEFICFFLGLSIGVYRWEWSITEMAVVFVLMGITTGVSAGFYPNEICRIFTKGAAKLTTGIFVIGLAATIREILTEGRILDTITYALLSIANGFPSWFKLMGMFYSNAVIDLFITSGSAHASVVMPVMTVMADASGLTRQSAVLAFQLGDGLVNLVSPISTTLTGVLAISETEYREWIRFYLPLVGIYLVLGGIFILCASLLQY